MKILTAADILQADDLEITRVEVPEWGGELLLRPMTGTERDRFEAEALNAREGEGLSMQYLVGIRARTVAMHACDATGELIFTSEQIDMLGKKNANTLDRVFDVCREISGITSEDVDELEGN